MGTKFYCESCNKEVSAQAEVCAHCGKIFSSTKCPVCQYESFASAFLNGCPRCGYMNPAAFKSSIVTNASLRERLSRTKTQPKSKEKAKFVLPSWVYLFSSIILIILLIVFLILIFQVK